MIWLFIFSRFVSVLCETKREGNRSVVLLAKVVFCNGQCKYETRGLEQKQGQKQPSFPWHKNGHYGQTVVDYQFVGCVALWTGGRTDGRTDGWMDLEMDGSRDRCIRFPSQKETRRERNRERKEEEEEEEEVTRVKGRQRVVNQAIISLCGPLLPGVFHLNWKAKRYTSPAPSAPVPSVSLSLSLSRIYFIVKYCHQFLGGGREVVKLTLKCEMIYLLFVMSLHYFSLKSFSTRIDFIGIKNIEWLKSRAS